MTHNIGPVAPYMGNGGGQIENDVLRMNFSKIKIFFKLNEASGNVFSFTLTVLFNVGLNQQMCLILHVVKLYVIFLNVKY